MAYQTAAAIVNFIFNIQALIRSDALDFFASAYVNMFLPMSFEPSVLPNANT